MTIRESILAHLEKVGQYGNTVVDFLCYHSHLNPQSVYPVFTKLCAEGQIKDSRQRRRSGSVHRRCIVWWLSRYGGTIPVWGSGRPRYSYTNRAKTLLDMLAESGPATSGELIECGSKLTSLGTSSLLSSLAAQGWVRKTRERRTSPTSNRRCIVWDITALGRSVREKRKSK